MTSLFRLFASLALAAALPSIAAAAEDGKGENLLVFVGQKIALTKLPPPRCDNCLIMDEHYVARYRILDTVHGNYRGGTIDFDVHDHYGVPAFSTYDTVLLFVSRKPDGSWVHEKYQFYDLYKDADGEWYGCGDPYRGAPQPPGAVRARPVEFAAPVSYPLDGIPAKRIAKTYPAGYFEIRDGRAYCLKGAPVQDLFEAKKQTVLAARGIFKQAGK